MQATGTLKHETKSAKNPVEGGHGMKRIKKRKQILLEAIARGINTPGGLARAVYGTSPRNRKARIRISQLRYRLEVSR